MRNARHREPPRAAAGIRGPRLSLRVSRRNPRLGPPEISNRRSHLKRLLQAALGKFGYRLSRAANTPKDGLTCFFEAIQRAGFVPRHIIDVGANRGNWTRTAIRFFPDAQYTLFEPQDHLKVHIHDLLDS